MKITDEMVERAARAMCVEGGFDPNERMPNDGPRWKYYAPNTRAALTAALAVQTQQGVEVKKLDWEAAGRPSLQWLHKAESVLGCYTISAPAWSNCGFLLYRGKNRVDDLPTVEAAKAAAQADYEQRIRSALVDVPAVESEPVAALQTVSQEDLQEALALLPSVMRPSMSARIIAAISEQADIIARFKRTSRARRLAFEAASSAHPPRSLSNEVDDLENAWIAVGQHEGIEIHAKGDDAASTWNHFCDCISTALSTRKGSAGDGAATGTKGVEHG